MNETAGWEHLATGVSGRVPGGFSREVAGRRDLN